MSQECRENRGKLLFIASQPFFQWRGSPIRVGFDVQALADLGFEVDLLTLPFGEDRNIRGVRIVRVANLFRAKGVAIGPSFLKACFDVLLLFEALGMIRKKRYQAIHCVEDAGVIGVLLAWLTGAKMVYEKHSDPCSYRKRGLRNLVMWMYSQVEGFMVRHADAVIGTGTQLTEQAKRISPSTPVFHIPDIPSSLTESTMEATQQARAKLTRNPDDILTTYVGSFAVYQGIDLLFNAIPIVCARAPRCRFVIVGGSDAEVATRQAELAKQGLTEAVCFVGKIPPDDLPNVLAASDILLSPRTAGVNTPLKLLDYLKAGRSILATNNEANRQILDDSSALFVSPDAVAFADGICRLVEDVPLRERLAGRGRHLIDSIYNYTAFKQGIAEAYGL